MMTAEPELISQAELARRLGVSRQYVNKLVRGGTLPLTGKKLDAASSIAILEQMANPGRPTKATMPSLGTSSQPNKGPTLAEAKTMKEVYLARMARLKYEEEAGKLVPKADVESRAADIGRVVKQNILSIPSRLMDQLADETDPREINAILEAELRRVLEQLAEELRRG
jgi:transcriptional regulator with XRE-family HTH domain